jgi:hypothetical protein
MDHWGFQADLVLLAPYCQRKLEEEEFLIDEPAPRLARLVLGFRKVDSANRLGDRKEPMRRKELFGKDFVEQIGELSKCLFDNPV